MVEVSGCDPPSAKWDEEGCFLLHVCTQFAFHISSIWMLQWLPFLRLISLACYEQTMDMLVQAHLEVTKGINVVAIAQCVLNCYQHLGCVMCSLFGLLSILDSLTSNPSSMPNCLVERWNNNNNNRIMLWHKRTRYLLCICQPHGSSINSLLHITKKWRWLQLL